MRVLNGLSAKKFYSFLNSVLLLFNLSADVESQINNFNSHCHAILDIVAPLKFRTVHANSSSPWLNDNTCLRCKCWRIEHLWKSTKLQVHCFYFKELLTE